LTNKHTVRIDGWTTTASLAGYRPALLLDAALTVSIFV